MTSLEELGQRYAEAQDAALADPVPTAVRQRVLERVSRRRSRGLIAGLALAACAGAAAAAIVLLRPTALGYTLVGFAAGSDVPAEASRPAQILFSDGSEIALDPSARGRVLGTSSRGARVALERGRARVAVRPRRRGDGAWSVVSGPFEIQVRGTVFDVQWSPERQALDVWLRRGAVTVRGPLTKDGVAMRAGQHLAIALGTGAVSLRDATAGVVAPLPDAPVPDAPAETPAAQPPRPRRASAPAPVARVEDRDPAWPRLVARGDSARVLADAEARGFDRALATASSENLRALADAARYQRRPELARRALLAQRERFAGTRQSGEGAFLLGKLAESVSDGIEAERWYDRYLAEAPAGSFASEALGRKMILLEERAPHGAAAREAARLYVRRFPGGTYASAAAKILAR